MEEWGDKGTAWVAGFDLRGSLQICWLSPFVKENKKVLIKFLKAAYFTI